MKQQQRVDKEPTYNKKRAMTPPKYNEKRAMTPQLRSPQHIKKCKPPHLPQGVRCGVPPYHRTIQKAQDKPQTTHPLQGMTREFVQETIRQRQWTETLAYLHTLQPPPQVSGEKADPLHTNCYNCSPRDRQRPQRSNPSPLGAAHANRHDERPTRTTSPSQHAHTTYTQGQSNTSTRHTDPPSSKRYKGPTAKTPEKP
jgi:hypothetical protein